jgi:hypothetical protein
MNGSQRWHFDSKRPRTRPGDTLTPDTSLDPNLGAVQNLPRRHWSPRFYLCESPDEDPLGLSPGQFPPKPVRSKTHPVFSPEPVPNITGLKVCPRSSKKSAPNSRPWNIGALDRKADIISHRYLYKRAAHGLGRTDRPSTFAASWRLTILSPFPQSRLIGQLAKEDLAGISSTVQLFFKLRLKLLRAIQHARLSKTVHFALLNVIRKVVRNPSEKNL